MFFRLRLRLSLQNTRDYLTTILSLRPVQTLGGGQFLENVNYVLKSPFHNAVPKLLDALKNGQCGNVSVAADDEGRICWLTSSLSELLDSLAELQGGLKKVPPSKNVSAANASRIPRVFQGQLNPLELVIFDGHHYWNGTSAEDDIHAASFTELTMEGGEAIFGVLQLLSDDYVGAKPFLKAIEAVLPYCDRLRVGGDGPGEFVAAWEAMCNSLRYDTDEISEFFSMMRQVRIAYARFARAKKRSTAQPTQAPA